MGNNKTNNDTVTSCTTSFSEQLFTAVVGDWKHLRPVWILLLLSSLTEQHTRLSRVPVVDTFMERAAGALGKEVRAIERPEDQCRPFNKLEDGQVRKVYWVTYSL